MWRSTVTLQSPPQSFIQNSIYFDSILYRSVAEKDFASLQWPLPFKVLQYRHLYCRHLVLIESSWTIIKLRVQYWMHHRQGTHFITVTTDTLLRLSDFSAPQDAGSELWYSCCLIKYGTVLEKNYYTSAPTTGLNWKLRDISPLSSLHFLLAVWSTVSYSVRYSTVLHDYCSTSRLL